MAVSFFERIVAFALALAVILGMSRCCAVLQLLNVRICRGEVEAVCHRRGHLEQVRLDRQRDAKGRWVGEMKITTPILSGK